MKAIVYEKNGSPDVLEYREMDDPIVNNDHVLIRVQAVSIEGGDLLNRAVVPPPVTPYIGGYQRAGVIEAVGVDVKGLQVGQRVAAFDWGGAYAELSSVPAHYVYPIPDSMNFEVGVTIPVSFGTAAEALLTHGGLVAGETVLITGAAGGVGLAAIQLAKSVGATVIGLSSSDQSLQRLKEYGMDFGINYKTEDIGERCQEITEGKGVNLTLDTVGGAVTSSIITAAAVGGRISLVGTASDPMGSAYNCIDLIGKQLSIRGIFFGMNMHTPRAHNMINDLFVKVAESKYFMPIDNRFSLEDAADAHRYVESERSLFGRVLLLL